MQTKMRKKPFHLYQKTIIKMTKFFSGFFFCFLIFLESVLPGLQKEKEKSNDSLLDSKEVDISLIIY